jgi:hypothetical protein
MLDGAIEYIPRKPEQTVLYRVVAEQLETFLACRQESQRPVPRFVEREFREFLTCGIAEHGFLRLHCSDCGCDRILPFSCKKRGICPSCGGRRMTDTAAHLVDHVFPAVPIRQWVLSLPFKLRYRMAYDSALMADVLNVFLRSVFGHLQRRARDTLALKRSHCGAVVFIQRFISGLGLNVHFHLIGLDGIYVVFAGVRETGKAGVQALGPFARVVYPIPRRSRRAAERPGCRPRPFQRRTRSGADST